MARTVDIKARQEFVAAAHAMFGAVSPIILDREMIAAVCNGSNLKYPFWLTNDQQYRHSWGKYILPTNLVPSIAAAPVVASPVSDDQTDESSDDDEFAVASPPANLAAAAMLTEAHTENFIPARQPGYVPFGNFSDLRAIVRSKKFYPCYITGHSGNGKTLMVEQICAVEGRECIRADITDESSEDDLIGSFRLVDGETVWQDGPALEAMKRGAVLLLDEVDRNYTRIMCLQPVLEGKSIYIKKINKIITPAPGFTVIATANTRGKGSDDGRYVGTNVMNEAFLDRFSATFEQDYPPAKTESKILRNVLREGAAEDNQFVDLLVKWAAISRKAFNEGGVSEIISTRRLVQICQAYLIFGANREKAMALCLNRFDPDTKNSFTELFTKLCEPEVSSTEAPVVNQTTPESEEIAF